MKACFGGRWKLGLQLKCLTHYLISYDAPSKKLWLFWVIKNIHIWWSTVFKMFMLGSYCLVAKLCLTLWNPTDCSPPGSSDHEIFQARILEWLPFPTLGEFSSPRDGIPTQGLNLPLLHLLYYWQVDSLAPPAAKSLQLCPTLCDPMDCCPPAPLSMGWSRQEYWSGLPCPPPKAPKYQYWGWRIFLYPHSLCCI